MELDPRSAGADEGAPPVWKPSGLVTLTTDFGLQDPYVGIMKGVVHRACPGVTCIDLSHEIAPQDVATAGFYLAHSWRHFPEGTVHVAVVDPGVGSERAILVAEESGHAFLAPDNGLLSGVLGAEARVCALDEDRFALPDRSSTFHGRDVFAPAAGALAGGLAPARAGRPFPGWHRSERTDPVRVAGDAGPIEALVVLVDRFGNLITGLDVGGLALDLVEWEVEAGGRRIPAGRTYSEVAPGEPIALVDSYGHLEVAVRDGDAARELNLGRGAVLTLRRRM